MACSFLHFYVIIILLNVRWSISSNIHGGPFIPSPVAKIFLVHQPSV